MDCPSVRERLIDLVRGRVSAPEEAELRAHVASCPRCAHEEQAERLLDAALAERLPPISAPATLHRRVSGQLQIDGARAPAGAGHRDRPRRGRPTAIAAAAAVVAAALGFLGGRTVQLRVAGNDQLADELVSDHLRALASTRPPDVESSDTHAVKPWFEGRLDFAPVVPADRGDLRLLGGSVGYVADRKAAVLSYALRRHRLTLLVFPRVGLPGFERAPAEGPPLRVARRGIGVACWAAGDLGYALVSDVERGELGRLADALAADTRRAAPGP